MKPIIVFMLCIAGANLIRAVVIVAVRKARPKWSSFALSLFVVGIVLTNIAHDYSDASGADILSFFGAVSFGMAFMAALMMMREAPESATSAHRS